MESHERISTPTDPRKLLEWILFAPSPITSILQSQLSTIDVINLSRVCRIWRTHLIPHSSETTGNNIQLHPLFRSLAVSRLTPQQERAHFVYRSMRGRVYNRTAIKGDIRFSAPNHKIDLDLFERVLGCEYLRAITRVYLDGTKFEPASPDEMKLPWIEKCSNLILLSLRWCSGINLGTIFRIFVKKEQSSSILLDGSEYPSPDYASHDIAPPNLRTLMFWGVYGIWRGGDIAGASNEQSDKLMKRYKTDLEWCSGEPHAGGRWEAQRLLDATMYVCTVCKKTQKPMCISCDLGTTCEVCSGYICRQCLTLKSILPTGGYFKSIFSDHAREVDPDCSQQPNMLEYFCPNTWGCRWRGSRHYFHPSCVPLPETLAPEDILSQKVCPGCGVYICMYGSYLCMSCKAGQRCCWKAGKITYCEGCGFRNCGNCGGCTGNKRVREFIDEYPAIA